MANRTPFFHITLDAPNQIDGEISFDHAYSNRNGKTYNPKAIARKYNKQYAWKGWTVRTVEVDHFTNAF